MSCWKPCACGWAGTYTVCSGEALAPGSVQTGAPSELNDGLRSAVRALWSVPAAFPNELQE